METFCTGKPLGNVPMENVKLEPNGAYPVAWLTWMLSAEGEPVFVTEPP